MSTRGVVAVGTIQKWRGVYSHSDSYPTGLGKELWQHLHTQILVEGKTLAEIAANILLFDDWRAYLGGGVCLYCGKIKGQPHTINADIYVRAHRGDKFPDPESRGHQHNSMDAAAEQITSENSNPVYMEWVYVIEPAANTVHVLASEKGSADEWVHVCVASLKINGLPPNWDEIECGAQYERCHHYAWHHFAAVSQSCRLGTREYLGIDPIRGYEVSCAILVRGKRYSRGGSGMCGEFAARHHGIVGAKANEWYEELVAPDGTRIMQPIAVRLKSGKSKPVPGVQWVYPPTLVNEHETIFPVAVRVKASTKRKLKAGAAAVLFLAAIPSLAQSQRVMECRKIQGGNTFVGSEESVMRSSDGVGWLACRAVPVEPKPAISSVVKPAAPAPESVPAAKPVPAKKRKRFLHIVRW